MPAPGVEALIERDPHRAARSAPRDFGRIAIPAIPAPTGEEQSTQAAFGRILLDLAKPAATLADRIVTTSPDVTVSTNLGAWVNQRGLFKRRDMADVFAAAKIPSAQKWSATNQGQHIELGIAESNLFLMLAALGLSGDLFGERLVPIGTLYDPFIARGLDSLNYACYQDARFLLVATPSGHHARARRRRAPVDQPAADRARPAGPAPLRARLRRRARGDDGGGLPPDRRSRRRIDLSPPLDPLDRAGRARRRRLEGRRAAGGYWLREPGPNAEAAIVAMGAIMPEALAAWEELSADIPGLGLLAVTSPDLLHRGWTAAQAGALDGRARSRATSRQLLVAPRARRRPRHPVRRRARLAVAGSAACSASASRRSASSASARPAAWPTSTPPTGSTAPRSPRRLPSFSLARLGDPAWPDAFSTSGRSATGRPRGHPHRHRDRQCADLGADPQSAADAPRPRGRGRDSEFGKTAGQSIYTFGLMVGVSVATPRSARWSPTSATTSCVFPAPVFVGDTLRCESECVDASREQVAAQRRHRHLGAPQLSTSATRLVCTMQPLARCS